VAAWQGGSAGRLCTCPLSRCCHASCCCFPFGLLLAILECCAAWPLFHSLLSLLLLPSPSAAAAVFMAKNAVLSSFASGRQTSLVVDAGHERTVGEWGRVQVHRAACNACLHARVHAPPRCCCCRGWLRLVCLVGASSFPALTAAMVCPVGLPGCWANYCNCGIITVARWVAKHTNPAHFWA
jgi:hypothetical protein